MRIAVSVMGNEVSASLDNCEAFCFFEDDHGKILRQYSAPVEGTGFDAALSTLERYGVDVLVCGALDKEERKRLAASGLLLSTDASGSAEDAARRYLGGAIACDPDNDCNYCGHKGECELPHKA
ncbi:MAG: hypothetical protein E7422_04555 [Ruminococcaceae bacterium]|nr:hypothetical protein [Oscillospiraceae bacterium]